MIDLINQVLARIFIEQNSRSSDSLSLFTGCSGEALFKLYYYKFLKIKELPVVFQNEIQKIAENSISYPDFTFCQGQAGINWFFNNLYQNEVLSAEDLKVVSPNIEIFSEYALNEIFKGNYDFLHGSLGTAFYILESHPNPTTFCKKYLSLINKQIIANHKIEMIPYYDFVNKEINPNRINLGLAHGIPSILKFCLQCIKQNICLEQAYEIALHIITFITNNKNFDSTNCFFQNEILFDNKSSITFSRLAWCYGDLGLAYILLEAGRLLNNKSTYDFALQVLIASTARRNFESTKVYDAGICHGSAGIGHIYNKLWLKTNDIHFKDACEFWISQTLKIRNNDKNSNVYNKYNLQSNLYVPERSFLEGSAGIGLVLLSYLTHDFSWDSCIMLND